MLEKLRSTFDRGIATVSVKSESMVEMSRIKSQIQNLQRQQAALTTQLGGEMYEMWKAGEMNRERFQEVCSEIYACEQAIAEQNRRMEQVRAEEQQLLGTPPAAQPAASAQPAAQPQAAGAFCPNCGTQNPDSAKFCVGCGTKLGE